MKKKQIDSTFLEMEEVKVLIDSIKQPVIRFAVLTMAATGLRVSECINLKLDDVDIPKKMIYVRYGKGCKDRVIPIHKDISEELITYLNEHRPKGNSDYFFSTKRSGTISNQYINRILQQTAKKVGIQKNVSSHDLRRAYASHLSHHNVNTKVIQMLLGHENLKTTSVYIFEKDEAMEEA